MKIIKRLISVTMVCVMLISVTACGVTDRDEEARKLDIETPVTINVWYDNKDYERYLNTVASGLKAANNLITVNPVYIEAQDIIDTLYTETVRNNNAPDVYLMSAENSDKAYLLGLMLENDSYDDIYNENIYGKAAIKSASYKGKLYGYPVSFDMPVMVYNKKYASSVDSYYEIKQISDNYQVTEENQNIKKVFDFDASDMLINYPYVGRYMNIGGDVSENADIFTIDELNFKRALKEYASLKNTFGIDRNESTHDSCLDEFTQNKLLYTIVNTSDLKKIDDSGVSYGIIPVPYLSEGLESVPMSITTLAVVNPYTSDISVAKTVARAISYDYAADMQALSGHVSARADLIKKGRKADNTDYNMLHDIYSDSIVKAKYVGVQNIYTRYEILIHQIWDGKSVDDAYNEFHKGVESFLTSIR
uniref:sugar ABC transporter substrate-binding protein n=1 Tax=Lachnospira sp. TaxID=2049031 RepID=UPI003FEE0948